MAEFRITATAYEVELRKPLSGWYVPGTAPRCLLPLLSFQLLSSSSTAASAASSGGADASAYNESLATLDDVTAATALSLLRFDAAPLLCEWTSSWELATVIEGHCREPDFEWEYAADVMHRFKTVDDDVISERFWARRRTWERRGVVSVHDRPDSSSAAPPRVLPLQVQSVSAWISCCTAIVPSICIDALTPRDTSAEAETGRRSPSVARTTHRGSERDLSARSTPRRSRASSMLGDDGAARISLVPVSYWMKDEDASSCLHCHKRFGVITRRHHCRLCGKVFCGRCCEKATRYGGVRVCVPCLQEEEHREDELAQAELDQTVRVDELQEELMQATSSNVEMLRSLVMSVERDTRAVIEQEEVADFECMASLGTRELAAVAEIAALVSLPSIVQLTDSCRVSLDDSLKKSLRTVSLCSPICGGVANATGVFRSAASPTHRASPLAAADLKQAESAAVQVGATPQRVMQCEPQLQPDTSGMLHLSSFCATDFDPHPQHLYRLDCKMSSPDSKSSWHGSWGRWESLQLYVMIPSLEVDLVLSFQEKGGNAVTDLVLDWSSTVMTASFRVSAVVHSQPVQRIGDKMVGRVALSVCRHRALTGVKAIDNIASLPARAIRGLNKIQADAAQEPSSTSSTQKTLYADFSFDEREMVVDDTFCESCGKLSHRCSCPAEEAYQPAEFLPMSLGETSVAAAASPEHRAGTVVANREAEKPLAVPHHARTPSEMRQAEKAQNVLLACGEERLLLEKQQSLRSVEEEEREAFVKLRGLYFSETNRVVRKDNRRRRYPEVEARLASLAALVYRSLTSVCLSRWHHQTVANAEQRRAAARQRQLQLQRQKLEARIATLVEADASHDTTANVVVARDDDASRTKKKRRASTSEKCCSVQ